MDDTKKEGSEPLPKDYHGGEGRGTCDNFLSQGEKVKETVKWKSGGGKKK